MQDDGRVRRLGAACSGREGEREMGNQAQSEGRDHGVIHFFIIIINTLVCNQKLYHINFFNLMDFCVVDIT